ncbi:MAG: hypothetical protein JO100_10960 [Pseudonocardia sp.]|nr:hypothetical protein [Pseudonocardia sp.]
MVQPSGATVAVVEIETADGRPAAISPSDRLSLVDALGAAAASAQISLPRLHLVDRACGMLLVADGNIPPATLAGRFVAELDAALARTDTTVPVLCHRKNGTRRPTGYREG